MPRGMPQINTYQNRAKDLADAGRIGEAIVLLEEAVARCAENAGICKLLAALNLRIHEIRAFQNWCHEALRIDEADAEPHQMLAAYFQSQQRDFEAEEELQAAARKMAKISR